MWWLLLQAALAGEGEEDLTVNRLCPKVPPAGWSQDYGIGRHRRQAVALQDARDEARQRLRDRTCAGMAPDSPRCTYLQRHMLEFTWGWDEKAKLACTIYSIERKYEDSYETDTMAFREELLRLADSIAEGTGTVPLDIDKPTWPAGCVASAGLPIISALRASLARHSNVRLVANDRREDGANHLHLNLVMVGSSLQVDAVLTDANRLDRPIGGFTIPADLLSVTDEEARECASDAALGLKNGEKLGAEELRVGVDLETSDGFACEGSPINATIWVSRPARVRIYSVLPDQRTWLVWPPLGSPFERAMQGTVLLEGESALIPIRLPDGAEERLVAVAVPEGQSFGPTEGWQAYCRSSRPMGPTLYPSQTAALGVAGYKTLGPGEGRCGKAPYALPDVEAQLEAAPLCATLSGPPRGP